MERVQSHSRSGSWLVFRGTAHSFHRHNCLSVFTGEFNYVGGVKLPTMPISAPRREAHAAVMSGTKREMETYNMHGNECET